MPSRPSPSSPSPDETSESQHMRHQQERVTQRPGPGAIAALLLAPLLLGYGVDALTGGGPGWGVVAGATTGALLAGLAAVRRRSLGWVAPLPALAVAGVTAGAVAVSDGPLPTRLVRWAVAVFPAMASAECAVAVVALTVAVLRSRMNGRRHA
ncbi:hypothetical protein ABZX85_30830 [Streptomyces sp. NPDC004539]|uniref:hypothetical protein n=1 Tax=Streptomyces sp. NPDC004539 TaxID=3154280 RepID=UPI0033B88E04